MTCYVPRDVDYHGDNAGCLGGDQTLLVMAVGAEDFSSRIIDLDKRGGRGGGEREVVRDRGRRVRDGWC